MSQFNDVANSPNDKEYADLKTISYHGLFYNEADALNRLYSACTEDGFFYLDLSSPKQEWLHDLVAQLNEASDRFFSRLPLAEKMLYDTDVLGSLKNYGWVQSALFESQGLISSRYKPSGRNSGVVNGKQDGHEMFLVSLQGQQCSSWSYRRPTHDQYRCPETHCSSWGPILLQNLGTRHSWKVTFPCWRNSPWNAIGSV